MQAWVQSVAFSTSTGNLEQLYPDFAPAGVNPATATTGQLIREPTAGQMFSLQVQTDGTNGGIIELWDVNGADAGADVSSAAVITNSQLTGLVARGKARLLYSQNFLATPETPIFTGLKTFQRGLAARFVGSAGAVTLNLSCAGGYRLVNKI